MKHLAGPPSEFNDFVPPDPYAVASIEHSAIFEIDLNPNTKTSVSFFALEISHIIIILIFNN